MAEIQYYVLFENHDNGLRLHKALKELGVRARISPTPRAASKCCGISLMIEAKDVEQVEKCVADNHIEILEIVALEKDINPGRNKFC